MTRSPGTILDGDDRPEGRGARTALRSAVAKSAICGGLVAGSVDIGAAALINLASPLRILLAISSGLLGKAAFGGGDSIMLLGLVLQWGMSVLIAAIYSLAAGQFPELARRWVLGGALYGLIVFIVMNFLVVPLSAAPFRLPIRAAAVGTNLVAMLVFGWIVAFIAHRFLTGDSPSRVGAPALR
jgi:uncharacterized membrane protein YagU involved in acid resistance